MSAHHFNPVIAVSMDKIVNSEINGWPNSHVISLKFLTMDGARLFNNAGILIAGDDRFVIKSLPSNCTIDITDIRVLQMLESSLIDIVLHLPVMDRPSNLWALGWDPDFKWSKTLPPRCAFDFAELLNILVLSIFETDTGDYKSFHHSWVRYF
jgi:hypothetical protein